MKKIFFLIPALTAGGAERVMLHLLNNINRTRYFPVLFLFDRTGEFMQELPEDIEVRILRDGKGRYRGFVRMVYNLRRHLQQEKPSLIMSFMWYANAISVIAAKLGRHKIGMIVSERTSTFTHVQRIENVLRNIAIRLLYPSADLVITPSRQMAGELARSRHVPAELLMTIPNPVDVKRIREFSREEVTHPWFSSDKPVIIGIGRMSREKGFAFLVRAVGLLLREGIACRLVLLGDGDERTSLKLLAETLGISESVYFPGFQQNPYKYLSRSTVYVLPSLFEGFPNTLIEALALGVPAVATRCPTGPEEIITDGENGILVPPADETALAQAVKKLLLDGEMREKFSEEGKKRAEAFEVKKIVKQYEDAIEKVCAESAGR